MQVEFAEMYRAQPLYGDNGCVLLLCPRRILYSTEARRRVPKRMYTSHTRY